MKKTKIYLVTVEMSSEYPGLLLSTESQIAKKIKRQGVVITAGRGNTRRTIASAQVTSVIDTMGEPT